MSQFILQVQNPNTQEVHNIGKHKMFTHALVMTVLNGAKEFQILSWHGEHKLAAKAMLRKARQMSREGLTFCLSIEPVTLHSVNLH